MRQSELRAPLFERLRQVDEVFDRTAMAASVAGELERLLNTRCGHALAGNAPGILGYGLADWTMFQSGHESDRRYLARALRQAIERFEPRLQLSSIEVQHDPCRPQRLHLRLHGQLRQGGQRWPALFVVSRAGETVEVHHE
ncbi:type VI secretion system baseplate subunit TssE [Stutzerimonas kirkiae]|uniref:type VI secretion system baseplate subunit TssE n=1 Tax=Stutzerimonas kirkiae TaxID=2211392 RepID=UPI0010385B3F|nr:type VI secretion system baseplate subunit TssE [Stutzerimonas kirkiae]TBV10838.1 type VI secretion system baseplate subunit TssE [Stutzerimonas kirkiae]